MPPPGHDRPRPSYGRAQWAKRIRAAVRAAPRRQSNTCKPQALQRGPACSASNEEPAANRRTAVVHASWNARTAPAAGGPIRNALRKAPCKNGVFTWPCSKQCRQMSTRPWAKCTRRASWHCVVHSQINPPSRAKDGARGARASTSNRLAAAATVLLRLLPCRRPATGGVEDSSRRCAVSACEAHCTRTALVEAPTRPSGCLGTRTPAAPRERGVLVVSCLSASARSYLNGVRSARALAASCSL